MNILPAGQGRILSDAFPGLAEFIQIMITQTATFQPQSPASAYARVQKVTAPKPPPDGTVREKNYSLRLGQLKLKYSEQEAAKKTVADTGPKGNQFFAKAMGAAQEQKECLFSLRQQGPEPGTVPRPAACRAYSEQQYAYLNPQNMINRFV
ncbi:MAG: hypothetical protein ACQES5_05530 [Thermodesulfobacteriota bacterium]